MATVTVQVIKTEADYQEALRRLRQLLNAPQDTPEGDEADVLTLMITAYEDKHVRIEPADPVEVIKFVMDQKDLRQADLAPYMGGKTRVSEVLNRKRELTKAMIINLSKAFDIPVEALMPKV